MSRKYRLVIVMLACFAVVAGKSSLVFAERATVVGGNNQATSDNKDDDDDHKDRDKDKNKDRKKGNKQNNGQNGQNSQNNQGSNSNSSAGGNTSSSKSGNSNTSNNSSSSSNSNTTQQFQQMIQRNKDLKLNNQNGQGQNNSGQGGSVKIMGPNQGGPGFKLPNQQADDAKDGKRELANKKIGAWHGDHWEGTRKVDNWAMVFGNKQKPFSAQWYHDHPQAWKYESKKSNVWVVASVPGVYSWLGWGNVPPQFGVSYGPADRFDPTIYGDWYPLGVYSLMTGPDDVGTRVVQLAVDRHGHLTGNYFDMIANANHNISGDIDRDTQRAEWWLNRNPAVHFHARIYRLLQPFGTITVELPGGEQRWQFVRLED